MGEPNQAAFLPIFLSSMPSMNRDVGDNVGELSEAAQASPAFLGAHGELMDEAQAALGAHTVSGLHRAQANGGEGGPSPGKEVASLLPPPLRTVHESCPSHGSSKPVTYCVASDGAPA